MAPGPEVPPSIISLEDDVGRRHVVRRFCKVDRETASTGRSSVIEGR